MLEVNTESLQDIRDLVNRIEGGIRRYDTGAAIGNILVSSAKNRINETKTDPKGAKWKDISERYQAWLDKHPSVEISKGSLLQRSGNMYDSVGYSLLQWGAGIIKMYSAAEYSAYHQEGTRKMPARPFLGLSDDDLQEIKMVLINKIIKDAKR